MSSNFTQYQIVVRYGLKPDGEIDWVDINYLGLQREGPVKLITFVAESMGILQPARKVKFREFL